MSASLEAIKRLLWEDWDPIGIKGNSNVSDEYDSYAVQIHAMLSKGVSPDEIAHHLAWIVTSLMGLGADEQRTVAIAKRAAVIRASSSIFGTD